MITNKHGNVVGRLVPFGFAWHIVVDGATVNFQPFEGDVLHLVFLVVAIDDGYVRLFAVVADIAKVDVLNSEARRFAILLIPAHLNLRDAFLKDAFNTDVVEGHVAHQVVVAAIDGAISTLAYLLIAWYLRRKKAALVAENDERVNRLFELREEARHRFAESVKVSPKDITANSREEELMDRVMTSVEHNMGNSDYTVDMLASDVCMSRASLYRAMQNMLGITPNDFIRNVRLKQAAQLLSDTNLSISDISARVGFGTPRYFTQHFKKMFGVLPSEYRSNPIKKSYV